MKFVIDFMRLNKFIAQAGVSSRRKADELIKGGQIKVNGQVIRELGKVIDENKDTIEIGQRKLSLADQFIYLALNKPVGYIASTTSAQGKSVLDLIKNKERIYPVGRLDKDSRGLIFLTNDGEFAYHLTQARLGCEKEYEVELDRPLKNSDKKYFERDMVLGEDKVRGIRVINQKGNKVYLVLRQGVNRQIRRMAESRGYRVLDLKRIRIGKFKLGNLKEGEYKKITPQEV